jgi:hypothetical protein
MADCEKQSGYRGIIRPVQKCNRSTAGGLKTDKQNTNKTYNAKGRVVSTKKNKVNLGVFQGDPFPVAEKGRFRTGYELMKYRLDESGGY